VLRADEATYASEQRQVLHYQKLMRRERIAVDAMEKRLMMETKKLSLFNRRDVAELMKFLGKAPLPEVTVKAMESAEGNYAHALAAAAQLTAADVEVVRDMQEPSQAIVGVVESACIALGVMPDYDTARQKLLSFSYLTENIKKYETSSISPNVIKQLQRRSGVTHPAVTLPADADALPCIKTLNDWVKALLQVDAIADEIAEQRGKVSVSNAMLALCLSACDIHALGDLDEDLMSALKLAEAVVLEDTIDRQQDVPTDAAAVNDKSSLQPMVEEDLEVEMESIEDKIFYLDRFKHMITSDVDILKPKIQPAQEKMVSCLEGMSRNCDEVKMELDKSPQGNASLGDSLMQDTCMILSLMFAEERAATPGETCLQLLDCSSASTLAASGRILAGRVMEGNVIMEHFQKIEMLHERFQDQTDKEQHMRKSGYAFCQSAHAIVECFLLVSDLTQKSSQLMEMEREHKEATNRVGVMRVELYGAGTTNVNTSAVRRLRKTALDLQLNISRAIAIMALSLCEESEERAQQLVSKLPDAKRFLAFLAKPALAAEVDCTSLSAFQVRNIQARLRTPELKTAVEALQNEWGKVLEKDMTQASKKIQKEEKAEDKKADLIKSRVSQFPKNCDGRNMYLPVGTRVQSRYAGGGENPRGFDTWYDGKILEILNDGEGYLLHWDDEDTRNRRVPAGYCRPLAGEGSNWVQLPFRCSECADATHCSACGTAAKTTDADLSWHSPAPGIFKTKGGRDSGSDSSGSDSSREGQEEGASEEDEEEEEGEEDSIEEDDEEVKREGAVAISSCGGLLSSAEEGLLRWITAVLAIFSAQQQIEPAKRNLKSAVRHCFLSSHNMN